MADDIYRIAQMIQNKKAIQSDLNEAFSLISTMFQDRYVNKLRSAVEESQLEHKNNPTKEVHLLHSLKAFFPQEKHEPIDKAISTLCMLQTLQTFKDSYHALDMQNNADTSIHEDGIYDIDGDCVLTKNNCDNSILNAMLVLTIANSSNN